MVRASEHTFARPEELRFEYLKNPLDGSIDLGVNGAVTAVNFDWQVKFRSSSPTSFHLERINIVVEDNAALSVNGFFSIAALANGILIQILDGVGAVVQDFGTSTNGLKTGREFGLLAGIDVDSDSVGAKSDHNVRWTISKTGAPMHVPAGHTIRFVVQDDLSAIARFRVMVQGVEIQ